ncbi:MAG: cytochrome d ubiquinol oxidase subunit II, partial [Acidobacteria bacterium]|nr:cytochrome d ubiquinol oxidase subunit II [Acidobacteriota bacterium]
IMVGLTLYALLGGADFGAGIWEFNTALQAPEKERALIYRAIGPVWEANHVWLIFVLVGLHTAFPPAFAAVSRALWIPLLLGLVGILFRGVGFAFRSYAAGAVRQQAVWGAVFALASTAAPFFLGAAAGAIASGQLALTAKGDYTGDYLTGWISPMSIFNAFFAVGVCAYLAAVYLTREAGHDGDPALVALWRQRALATGAWMGILAMAGLMVVATDAPVLWKGFRARAWPLVGLSILGGIFSLLALLLRRFTGAVLGAGVAVAGVLWGWGVAQYPVIIPPAVIVKAAKGPDAVLWALIGGFAIGATLLVPSLGYLFYLFKGKRPEFGGNGE